MGVLTTEIGNVPGIGGESIALTGSTFGEGSVQLALKGTAQVQIPIPAGTNKNYQFRLNAVSAIDDTEGFTSVGGSVRRLDNGNLYGQFGDADYDNGGGPVGPGGQVNVLVDQVTDDFVTVDFQASNGAVLHTYRWELSPEISVPFALTAPP
jgi:hypothetical protein